VKIALPLLLCGVVVSPVSDADTETFKLTCDLVVTTQPPYGDSKQSHETAVVEMLFDAATGFKAIRIHSGGDSQFLSAPEAATTDWLRNTSSVVSVGIAL